MNLGRRPRPKWFGCLPTDISALGPFTFTAYVRMSDDDNAKIVRRREHFSFFRPSVYPPRMAPIGAKLWENAFQMIPNVSFSDTEKNIWTIFLINNFDTRNCFFQETGDLEEPDTFERHWQIRRKKLLPEVGLLLGRLPWRRGKRLNLCRKS